jgi:hypothetical protein
MFADHDREALRRFPEIHREGLLRFFRLTAADVAHRSLPRPRAC